MQGGQKILERSLPERFVGSSALAGVEDLQPVPAVDLLRLV